MSNEILTMLRENVIQGRKTKDDEGVEGNLMHTPGTIELIQQALDNNIALDDIISQGLTSGMQVVGEKFNSKEYFIPDMLASADAVAAGMDMLRPYLEKSDIESKGKFVIATVKGDIHDIGKDIVTMLVKGEGYEVNDLGIDVPTEKIVEVVKNEKPDFLGLSALLTTTMVVMGEIIEALKEAGLRDSVKVLIGGAAISEEFAQEIGADAYCADGFQAIEVLHNYQKVRA